MTAQMKKRWSLRGKLVFISCFIALLVAIISYAFYAYTLRGMAGSTVLENLRSLQQTVEDNLAAKLAAIDRTAKNIIVGDTVYGYLQDGAPDLSGDDLAQSVLRTGIEKDMTHDLLFDAAFSEGMIESVYLYLSDTNVAFLSRTNRSTDKNLLSTRAVYEQLRETRFWGRRCHTSAEDSLLYFSHCLYPLSAGEASRNLYLILTTSKSRLRELFAPLQNNDSAVYFVTDADGQVILSSQSEAEGAPLNADMAALPDTQGVLTTMKIDGEDYFVSTHSIGDDLRSITLLPTSRLTAGVDKATWRYLVLCLVVLAGCILLVLPLALRLTNFTNDFVSGIRRFAGGDFTVKLPSYHDHDLAEISSTFNQMTEEIDTLIKERYEKQMLIQQMDIAFLQSQMNPHFLFNVLLSISARAKMDHDELLFEMVQSLTTLLQAGLLQKNAVKIPFRQELTYVNAYLNIQRLRFGNRIGFEIDVPEELQGLLIPRLSVQPLVENAVLHGLDPREEGGVIRVSAQATRTTLDITVEDDGCGFDPASLQSGTERKDTHNNIALANLRKRIELIYGDGYTLRLRSAPNMGCSVTLHLPREEGTAYEQPRDSGG